jgi:hypothetical protein
MASSLGVGGLQKLHVETFVQGTDTQGRAGGKTALLESAEEMQRIEQVAKGFFHDDLLKTCVGSGRSSPMPEKTGAALLKNSL